MVDSKDFLQEHEPSRGRLLATFALAFLVMLPTTLAAPSAHAQGAVKVQPMPQAGNIINAVDEARVQRLTAELRCLVCQNQTVADSTSDLANDLRREVRTMLARGASDKDVIDFMTARYGDFVLYRPPVKATTVLLWVGPALLLVGGLSALVMLLRRRSRLPDDAFEADDPLEVGVHDVVGNAHTDVATAAALPTATETSR